MLSKESSPESIPTCSGTLKYLSSGIVLNIMLYVMLPPLAGQRFQKAVLFSPIFRLTELEKK